jgi:hypothetical protein
MWGALEHVIDTHSPKYDALVSFTGGVSSPGIADTVSIGMNSQYGVYKSRPIKIPLN